MNLSRRELLAGVGLAAATAGCQILRPTASTTSSSASSVNPPGEDGSRLWLRYTNSRRLGPVTVFGNSATAAIIRTELAHLDAGTAGTTALYVGGRDMPVNAAGNLATLPPASLGNEGFSLQTGTVSGRPAIVIRSEGDPGLLYGAFHFLRLLHCGAPLESLNIVQRPALQLRVVNHWDNLDRTIERGYAGKSLWNWNELPGKLDPRLTMYARANASIGINGTVLNNVNSTSRFINREYLAKIKALADLWRPYNLRVYLSISFSSPKLLGGLPDADPQNPAVVDWWKKKADEIYILIPDFGGFLVKANSEGQPGPQDYGRTHAQGANMLADALAPHKGHVIWRAFIYNEDVDPDRAKRAYIEFTALEGQFRPNVLLQVKNGPIDFQPREPFHPLFGALPKTPVMAEIQATQEYLGQAKHLVYLGTMWEEFLSSDTFAKGPGSTVARVIQGKVHPYAVTGMACVLNTGTDANWCGHDFSQANWYAFGRLAWNPELSAREIAEEWVRQTFTTDPAALATILDMMMSSREIFVNYTMPLGLHHLIGGNHYAPMPENAVAPRRDWTAVYYHQAAADGIGFDRTRKGDKAVDQYFPPVAEVFDDLAKCPEKFLLWFHRLPWDHRMASGRTLWVELVAHYRDGARRAAELADTWQSLAPHIDPLRHQAVAARLAIQKADSAAWCDRILAYFQRFSGQPI